MAYLTLTLGLALPCLLGIALLLALGWPAPRDEARGTAALRLGYGVLVGWLLLTLWMRAVSAVGAPFGWASIGAPLIVVTAALLAFAARAGRLRISDARTILIGLLHPAMGGWRRVMWTAIIAWLAWRFALLAAEIAWRPLYPWDAWTQWATKARVWYELGHIVPFVRADEWLAGVPGYYDVAPQYPATVPLLQVWTSISLGRWDDAAMNWPWLFILIALVFIVYGSLRDADITPLGVLVGSYLVASLPLIDTHVALAGYADLPMAAAYTGAALALHRWTRSRDSRDAGMALFLAFCCVLIKTPGIAWALTLLFGAWVALFPRRGMRTVLIAFAITALVLLALALNETVILGYRLNVDFEPQWRSLAEAYLLFGNWNLMWYAVIALALLGWRRLKEPRLAPLAVVIGAGLAFLFVVFGFTNAAAWVADQTTVNRATLHLAPLLVVFSVLVWHEVVGAAAPKAAQVPSRIPA